MIPIRYAFCLALLTMSLLATGCAGDRADVALRSGKVFTMDPANPWAEAVIIKGERVIHVGDDVAFDDLVGPRTEVIDLQGRLVLPGLCNNHGQLLADALAEHGIDLEEASSYFTTYGDFGSRPQDECGSIREGGYADLMVLDRDLFPIDKGTGAEIDLAFSAGEIVYARE